MNAAGFTATTIGEPSAKQPTGYAALDLSTSPAATPAAKIVEEFQYLLEKSQQLFAGLRDLPPMGGPRQWQPYFLRSFEVYTKVGGSGCGVSS